LEHIDAVKLCSGEIGSGVQMVPVGVTQAPFDHDEARHPL
jgi:hypothetical protein